MDHHHTKQRVADFGEVFTAPREVEAMVDLVGHEADRLDSRFLEPACGDGNFLAVILTRKLAVAERLARPAPANFARLAIQAVTSLYGVEIQQGHVEACRKRLLAIVAKQAERHLDDANLQPFLQAIIAVLARNILWGDALTLKEPNSETPILFSQWSFIGDQVKRRDFKLHTLLAYQPMEGETLFSDLGDQAFIPTPVREFEPVHFLELAKWQPSLGAGKVHLLRGE